MQLQSLQHALLSYLAPHNHGAPKGSHASSEADKAASAASTGGSVWRTPTAAVWQEVELIATQAANLLAWANHQLLEFGGNGDKADATEASAAHLLQLKEASMHLMHDLLIGHFADGKVKFHNVLGESVTLVVPMWGSSSPHDRKISALGLAHLCRNVEEEVPVWAAYHDCLDDEELTCQRQQAECIWSLLGESLPKPVLLLSCKLPEPVGHMASRASWKTCLY